ncbi:hypothetical protein [Tahibacter sp.]|uniref:hypothetical protein n=1 Tax=Tahibacter sp. TaxID=2056211 RepID=UPI0028C4605F|nr:hypothetical protein [Tahibacter sp.]
MPASPSPLIHRLRRYLRVVALLCVGLVVMKSGVAALCAAEAFAAPQPAAVSAGLAGADLAGADLDADSDVAVAAADAGTGPCWHGGAGGCHCACAHVMTLLPALAVVAVPESGAQRFSAAPCALRGAPQDDALRPPIA